MQVTSFSAKFHSKYLVDRVHVVDNILVLDSLHDSQNNPLCPYFAAFIADFCRNKLLSNQQTFTVETVMSHRSKLDYMPRAQQEGFKVYLYFITTKDVQINIERVKSRVLAGGHDVPEDKIKSRYDNSLKLLVDALKCCERAYVVDTSEEQRVVVAEVAKSQLDIKHHTVPSWFQEYVLDHLQPVES